MPPCESTGADATSTTAATGFRLTGSRPACGSTTGRSGRCDQRHPGTLEYFLVERYCLYTLDEGGGVLRGDIHHPPWPLQLAEAGIDYNTMTRPYDIDIPPQAPVLHFARRQYVVIWSLAPAA